LSKGNSRLAIMATTSILDNNNIEILKNVPSLYDEYFRKIQTEVSIIAKREYLHALGILSFFGVLERNNDKIEQILKTQFHLDWNKLWEIFLELEQYEIV